MCPMQLKYAWINCWSPGQQIFSSLLLNCLLTFKYVVSVSAKGEHE